MDRANGVRQAIFHRKKFFICIIATHASKRKQQRFMWPPPSQGEKRLIFIIAVSPHGAILKSFSKSDAHT